MTVAEFTGPPVRLQLSRTAGFDLQALSFATNGRIAANCARPGWAGNPFHHWPNGDAIPPALSGEIFRVQLEHRGFFINDHGKTITTAYIRKRLAGKNLACFCPPDCAWCHLIPLLEVANS